MSDLGQAYVQIVPKATGISGKIGALLEPGSREAGEKAGSTIGSGIKRAIVAAGIGTAVVGAIKSAVSEGGKLEQSYGGLETIYGDAAEQAKRYAKEAAQAGVSANDYAEQAVSFGASLKQAFGGDTTKSVEAANTAIMDMTDNAAKMGTPIESIQNAYQGFAKQNYTMLDNLKLGYGGTKQEMERLLEDAEKLTGQEYDINNLGDVYDAIHAIQGDLGLTGVAAEEASQTFEGSFNAMKANAKNFLGALALGEGVDSALSDLISSVFTFLNGNLIPMVINVISALPGAIATIISEGIPQLLTTITEALPQVLNVLLTGLPQILTALVTMMIESVPVLVNALMQIVNTIVANIPVLLPAIINAGLQLFTGLIGALPEIITTILAALPTIISSVLGALTDNIPLMIDAGIQLFIALVEALPEIIDVIVAALPQIISAIVTGLLDNIDKIILAGVKLFVALVANLPKIIAEIVKAVPKIIKGIVDGFADGFDKMADVGMNLIKGLWNGIKGAGGWLWDKVSGFLGDLWDGILDFFGIASPSKEMAWVGQMIGKGLANGVIDSEDEVLAAADELGGGIMSAMSGVAGNVQPAVMSDLSSGQAGSAASTGSIWDRFADFSDSIVNGMGVLMAAQSGGSGDITIPIYLYPSGPKMGEETVKMYDTYKRQLG